MVPNIPISFNTIVEIDNTEGNKFYCVPYIEINKDLKEIAIILNDKKELDKIFREKQFKSFDDMVILDFYNEITKKLSDTKDYLRKTDPDIRHDIIEDLYNKLFALYDIKEYYFKDKVKDKEMIKEKYIKDNIRKNNNLSIGGSFWNTKKEKEEIHYEIDTLLQTITNSLKDKSVDQINNEFSIDKLIELSNALNDKSIYKKNIEELIDIHDSLFISNRETLLAEQSEEAKKYIKKKKDASGKFVLNAIEKYKELKKSFVDKVNKDKDDIEKMLEEEAGGYFVENITYDTIVNNNSGTYIKKLKNLNNYLYKLNKLDKNKKTGGAAPTYDVQKLKKDDGEKEVSENTPLDYYKKLKDNYVEIVNQYYKLVDDVNKEEDHYNFLYNYEGLINTENVDNVSNGEETHQSKEKNKQPDTDSGDSGIQSSNKEFVQPDTDTDTKDQNSDKTINNIKDNENKLNKLNEKIQLLENRIKLLEEIILKLPKEFEKLYKVMKSMKGLSQATEYEDYIINILKVNKIEFFEKDKDKHPIIKTLNNEKKEREVQLKKLKSQREEAKKAIKDQYDILKAQSLNKEKKIIGGNGDDNETEIIKIDLKLDNENLTNRYKTFHNLIDNDKNSKNNNNLHFLIINLKKDVEYLENNDDANQGSDKQFDIGRDRGIYEDIWYDYNLAVNKKDNKNEKWKNYLLYLTEGEKVHDRVIQNNLDPEIVLKINFRDKAIYIFLMFLIRTINIIALEFLIEYNLIKSLQYTIMLYGFMYLFIISLLVILVNYDSYKLRILFNYLNIHINSSNLLLQNLLFIIFIILVYILVKSDDFLKYFGDLFDFTNIYNNIYKFNESLNEDSDINLTQNEKLKLLYRIDIISMIIFIFSAFLVLIL